MTNKIVVNHTNGKKLIGQKFFKDFNWDYEWTEGEIIHMEYYKAVDHRTKLAASYVKQMNNIVCIRILTNNTARKVIEQDITNIKDLK